LDAQAPLRQVTLRYTAAGSDLRNDMKINAQSYVGHPDGGHPVGISLRASINLAAAHGDVRLRSASADVQPAADFHFLEDEFDRRRLREAVRLCASLGTHPRFQALVEERVSPADADLASDRALDDWLRRGVGTSQHFAGTCRMGPATDPTAVVDQYGVVHGLERLRVIDASIMPTSVRANTNLTTMMLAERTADLIRAGH
jgi:choline dehydrogenase-like flavoprotein